jgi:hypothetical protein
MIYHDRLPSISIYDLLKAGHLTATNQKPISTTIQVGDHAQIQLSITINCDQPGITISDPINAPQNIRLLTKPFNLNKGSLWYFICPITGTSCRKLYYYNGRFQCRQAINGRYELQSITPKIRKIIKQFTDTQVLDKMRQQIIAPHRRSTYAGSPTASTRRILAKIRSMT